MSIRLGTRSTATALTGNRHAEFVCEPDELWEQMRHAGWTVDRRSRHFCGSHGTHAKTRWPPLTRTATMRHLAPVRAPNRKEADEKSTT